MVKGDKFIEGSVLVAGEKAIIRRGSLDSPIPKTDILFVAETKDEVYRFMLAKVKPTDAVARLKVARWCMFAGLRDQALTEAREVLKIQPSNAGAAELARSLEESLKEYPGDGSTPVPAKPPAGTLVTTEPEPDVTPEGATTFASRAQPVLANQCMDCHARPDYPGAFKLIRITGFEVGPQSTKANLRATAAQLKKDDPQNSPLLTKALATHGGMKQPAFVSRQAAGFRVLEAWVAQAVPPVVAPMTPPAQPVLPSTPPTAVVPPMPTPSVPTPSVPAPSPVLPPVEPIPLIPPGGVVPPMTPALPTAPAAPLIEPPVITAPPMSPITPPLLSPQDTPTPQTIPLIPPTEPTPASEPKVPAVLPTPPSLPPADMNPKSPMSQVPASPMMPPAGPLPKIPGDVQPGSAPGMPSQFGTQAPPKPPAPSGPTGGDEFDPDVFNKATGPGK